ncbi:MAG: molybdenum cofactor biosynthesis protein B [Atopobiaceae bacterium]
MTQQNGSKPAPRHLRQVGPQTPSAAEAESHERVAYGGAPEEREHFSAVVITVSDRCSRGERQDASGPALVELLEREGYQVVHTTVVPDDLQRIQYAIAQAAEADAALVLTTGGTGFSPRDVTPEATTAICERMAPGIPEAMRAASMAITPHGCLSREACGILGRTLVVNLPGSPKAAVENVSAVIGPIAHGLRILRGGPADCAAQPVSRG